MEATTQVKDQPAIDPANLELIAKGESIVQSRVRQELDKAKEKLSTNSAFIAAMLGIIIANGLVADGKIPLTGDYRYLWGTLLGLVAGSSLGERIMLVMFGVLIGVILAPILAGH